MAASTMHETQGYWDVAQCRWIGASPTASSHLVPPALLRTVALRPAVVTLPAQRTAARSPQLR